MHRLMNDDSHLMNRVTRKVEALQNPIATIEICLYLLAQERQSDQLSTIKTALQNIRQISKQLIVE